MRSRAFLPPPTCSVCSNRPVLGETLIHTGDAWVCAACLTDQTPGSDTMAKIASHSVEAGRQMGRSLRAKAAGKIEDAALLSDKANWHRDAEFAIKAHGDRQAQSGTIVNGEALPRERGYLRDTLVDPDIVAYESSETRGHMLQANDVVALGVDVANTARASNTHEKLIAHQVALAHKVAMEQAMLANHELDRAIGIKRLQISARMMAMAQQGVITLQKLKSGGTQNVVVQHVYVGAGGQAVVACGGVDPLNGRDCCSNDSPGANEESGVGANAPLPGEPARAPARARLVKTTH